MNKSEIEKQKIIEIIAGMPEAERAMCKRMIDALLASVGHPLTGNTFMMAVAYVNTEMAVTMIKLGIVNEDGTLNSPIEKADAESGNFRTERKERFKGMHIELLSVNEMENKVIPFDHPLAESVAKKNYSTHTLYQDGDLGIPDSIKDRNGNVCLDHCMVCGAGEIELLQRPCKPKQ